MTNRQIDLQYTFTTELAQQSAGAISHRSNRKLLTIATVCFVAGLIASLIWDISTGLPIIFAGIMFLFLPLFTKWLLFRQYKGSEIIGSEHQVTINDSGIKSETDGITSDISWKRLHKIEHKESGYLIYTTPAIVSWLPKSLLDHDECNLMTSFIDQHQAMKV